MPRYSCCAHSLTNQARINSDHTRLPAVAHPTTQLKCGCFMLYQCLQHMTGCILRWKMPTDVEERKSMVSTCLFIILRWGKISHVEVLCQPWLCESFTQDVPAVCPTKACHAVTPQQLTALLCWKKVKSRHTVDDSWVRKWQGFPRCCSFEA